jgi:SAM-dependent methyltransferase
MASSVAPVASGYERDAASLHNDDRHTPTMKRHSETSSRVRTVTGRARPGRGGESPPARPLEAHEDAFGRLLLDYLDGRAGPAVLERDDGYEGAALAAATFFADAAAWVPAERELFHLVRGRVLDVGAGAGRHSLEAQRLGCDPVAVDISPGAVEVCRRRGVRDVRLLPLARVDEVPGPFDTVLMLCGNFGLVGDGAGARATLAGLARLTSPGARVLLDTVDPAADADDADRAYEEANRRSGRMPGQVTIRIRYRSLATPWYDLLNVSATELSGLVDGTGWHVERVLEAEPPDVFAVLAKDGASRLD